MRRILKSASEDPITIRPGDKATNPECDQTYDIRNAKRVRFTDKGWDMDSLPDHVAPRRRHETIQSPRSDVPKTSEYAYFRNIMNRSVPVHPGSLHKKKEPSKSCKTYCLNTESNDASDIHKLKSKDFEFSVSEERIRPSNHHTPFSPRVNVTCNFKQRSPLLSQELTPRVQDLPSPLNKALEISDLNCNTKQRSSLLSQNLTPGRQYLPSSPLNESLEISGNQCSKKGIFSEKRHRLRQWVVRTSSPGSDLVASLLSRLFPKSEESYFSSTGHSDNNKSLLVHESKHSEKEPLPHTIIQDEHLPIIRYGNSNEIIPSKWNIYDSRFYSHKPDSENLIEYDIVDLDQRLKSRQRKQVQFYQFKEVEEFCSPVEHEREETHNNWLLLDWDPERDEQIWHNNDYQKMTNHEIETKALCSSFLPSKYSVEFNSVPNYESDQFALTLPFTPKAISLEDDRNAENMISYRDQLYWLTNKAWDGKQKYDSWQKCLYATDISEEDTPSIFSTWQFPRDETSLFSFSRMEEAHVEEHYPFSGNAFDNYFSSFNYQERFQSSLDSFTNHHLLLNNFSKDRFQIDLYPDDDNDLEYGQVL